MAAKSNYYYSTFNDQQIYSVLERLPIEDDLDLTNWRGQHRGPRVRGLSEGLWTSGPRRTEWKRLVSRMPNVLADEISYTANRILDIACRIHPHFQTLLANHVFTEWLLHANMDNENYREHLVHPYKVAGVAMYLLEKTHGMEKVRSRLTKAGKTGLLRPVLNHWGLTPRVLHGKEGTKIIRAALWTACLFHDLGYGHNFMCQLEKRLGSSCDFYAGDIVGGSVSGLNPDLIERSLLRSHLSPQKEPTAEPKSVALRQRANPTYPPKKRGWEVALYENLPRNHSLAGAINLLCLFQGIMDYWPEVNPRLGLVFELAAEAIFLHDLTGLENYQGKRPEISFDKTPLAAFLILADEIQCWGRPGLEYSPKRREDKFSQVVVHYRTERDGVYFKFEDLGHNEVILKIDDDVWEKIKSMELAKDQKNKKGQAKINFWDGLLEIKGSGKTRKKDFQEQQKKPGTSSGPL